MNFQNDFSVKHDLIYLNSGTMALTPDSVLTAQAKAKAEFESNPSDGLFSAWPRMWQVQKNLAQFFNARPQDLFLRANVTYAMNDFLLALKLPPNSEIIISDVEYGAIVHICRYKAELEGHQLKVIKGDENFVETLKKSMTSKTRLVMTSHVTTGSGFVFPIEDIAELCRQKQVFYAVDGAHGAGSVPLDFSKTKVDFYGSNLHKWMMGPKGTGFGWVAPHIREYLVPRFAGWTTYDVMPHFTVFGDNDPWTVRWMICSTHNFSDYYAIPAMLDYWTKKDPKNILSAQKSLREYCSQEIHEQTGWAIHNAHLSTSFQGPMVAFELPPKIQQLGFEFLFHLKEKEKLQVSVTSIRNHWHLRLAPHVYNSKEEIQKAAKILKSL